MTRALGVDGCRGGWVGALLEPGGVRWLLLASVTDALALDVDVVGVDMPIGLPPAGRRACDLAAKRLLGPAHPRVFLTPPRAVLATGSHPEASALHRTLVDGRGMSVQTWHILARVAEVDAVADDPRLVEVHPEVSFVRLAGRALPSKRTAAGRAARLAALAAAVPGLDPAAVPAGDDAVDALAVAWSAARWACGAAEVLPAGPTPYDERGRPMRIVA